MKTASPDLNSYAQDINHIVPVIVLSSERKKDKESSTLPLFIMIILIFTFVYPLNM